MTIVPETYQVYLNALLQGERSQCLQIVNDYWEQNAGLIDLYEKLIKKSMYDIGKMWENNEISVAAEHLASGITEIILNNLQFKMQHVPDDQKKILTCCVENEYHQIGIKMISDIFEKNGWKSYFLGANVPTKKLIQFAKLISPNAFALSLSLYFHLPTLGKIVREIRAVFPNSPILVGGQAFRYGGEEVIDKLDNVILIKDGYQTESYIKTNLLWTKTN